MQHVVSMLSVDRMLAPTQFSHEGVHDDNLKPDIPNRNLIFGLQLRLDCEAKLGNLGQAARSCISVWSSSGLTVKRSSAT